VVTILTARATCEAFVMIYIAHCLAGITGTEDLVSTAQTLPCDKTVNNSYSVQH